MSDPASDQFRSAAPGLGEIRPAGDCALLVMVPRRTVLTELVAALRIRPGGVVDVLPAAETVLVTLSSPAAAEPVRKQLAALLAGLAGAPATSDPLGGNGSGADPVRIPVRYDGTDLPEVAALLGLTRAELIAQHTGVVWRCAFAGFAPGFGYLESPDRRLTVPRRAQSRTAIPAGAVALAGGYSAVYPRRSPGGWQLIGSTELTLWDVDRDPPALVRAGSRVQFVAVEGGAA
ncbi:allophanate hydrolase subunit 1 [Nocardia sp. NPDC088792]|uniref:5-oxoprolinase subunit B family protein n=1 Tax=Nocardia sp. NPDC088792 TaxID=3364332 RepID=UPI00381E964C